MAEKKKPRRLTKAEIDDCVERIKVIRAENRVLQEKLRMATRLRLRLHQACDRWPLPVIKKSTVRRALKETEWDEE